MNANENGSIPPIGASDAPPRPRLCLTLDVEQDYGRTDTYRILRMTDPFMQWVREERVPLTAFVTGRLIADGHPIVDQLAAAGAAVELHGFNHSMASLSTMYDSHAAEIEQGTAAYEKRLGRRPLGYRAPAGVVSAADLRLLDQLGYRYDSSIFPVCRAGHYDFRALPSHPFRWAKLRLLEFPVGLLTSRIPAGLSFTNLMGPRLSIFLMRRSIDRLTATSAADAPFVLDGHFHNLFADPEARSALPPLLACMYRLGEWMGGLDALRAMFAALRGRGIVPASLADVALQPPRESWPEQDLGVFTGAVSR